MDTKYLLTRKLQNKIYHLQSTNMMVQLLSSFHTNVHKILGTLKSQITGITDYINLCQFLLNLF